MNNDLDPCASDPVSDPATPPGMAHRLRRLRVAALLNTTALLSTTVLLSVATPKIPPYKGD